MALKKLLFKPGISRDNTNYANEGGWYEMDKVRFRSGFAEKIGGWQVLNFSPYAGQCRSLYNYRTTDGSIITGLGTSEKFYALVSFAFNLGVGTLQRSTVRSAMLRGDKTLAGETLLKYCRAGGKVLQGLQRRRLAEHALLMRG